jgi:uncharacterized RDD family membrane protein YckC
VTAYEQLTIDTPEQIALEFPLAGVGSRCLAMVLDTLIQAAFGIIVLIIASLLGFGFAVILGHVSNASSQTLGMWVLALVILVLFSAWYGYFALFEIIWRGQTPGKRALGLRVISASGRPMTPTQAILRNLLRVVDQLPALYAVAIISVLISSRNQRLGDIAAGTVVVREQETEAVHVSAQETAVKDRLRANRLTDQELSLIERFLQRRDELDPELRGRTALQIATRIRERLGITEPAINNEDLLERVLAEYRTFGPYR